MIALLFALSIASTQAAGASQDAPDWRMAIEEGDWTFAGESEGIVSFGKRRPADPSTVLFRYEYRDDQFSRSVPRLVQAYPVYAQARSSTAVVEIDCERRRRRALEETLYRGRNMSGDVLLTRAESRRWITPESGSVGYQQLAWACPSNGTAAGDSH